MQAVNILMPHGAHAMKTIAAAWRDLENLTYPMVTVLSGYLCGSLRKVSVGELDAWIEDDE